MSGCVGPIRERTGSLLQYVGRQRLGIELTWSGGKWLGIELISLLADKATASDEALPKLSQNLRLLLDGIDDLADQPVLRWRGPPGLMQQEDQFLNVAGVAHHCQVLAECFESPFEVRQ